MSELNKGLEFMAKYAEQERQRGVTAKPGLEALLGLPSRPPEAWLLTAGQALLLGAEGALREGTQETPARFAKAWAHWTSGYTMRAEDILKTFEDGAKGVDEMVVVANIPLYSKCEHHLADIFGTATVGYIPNGKVVGLSKLSRLVDMHARRLQVQERLTNDIANDLFRVLQPLGVGVKVKARHMCMESRGICQQGHHTITMAMRGAMKDNPETRAEFLAQA